ncbi:MAG: hypothetical protein RIR76_2105 [Verrucomicrobiota bacterium]|jgi:glycosyltransferase involved in cell wall biosynthesis|nr:glycosyltransferase family 2 protein [Opitutaceae bacterium]
MPGPHRGNARLYPATRRLHGARIEPIVQSSAGSVPRLSVVIVARNEERNLPRCLASVCGWTDEIIVALNGTTDGSEAVARGAAAAVHHLPWRGYRDTKNDALGLARNNWVLALDADEEVSPELRREITAFLAGGDRKHFSGVRFPRKVWFIDRWITHGDWYPDLSLRLFRRDRARWGGDAIVHEKIECDGPVATVRGDLHHYSFPDVAAHLAKITPFADLFVRQQREKGGGFGATAAVTRPLWRFFRAYVLRRGFLDGFPGLYIAVATSFGVFVRHTRLFESERVRAPETGK